MKDEDEARSVGQVRIVKTITGYLLVINAVGENDVAVLKVVSCEEGLDVLVALFVKGSYLL